MDIFSPKGPHLNNELLLSKLDKFNISFLNEKKTLNSSKNTITTYIYILESFYKFIVESNSVNFLEDITKEVILTFLNKEPKASTNTRILRLAVLKSYFKYIDEQENLNGLFEIRFKKLTIKQEHKEVDALTEDEQQRLLALFSKHTNSFNKNRDALLIKILLHTGVRASELLDIKLEDASLIENNTVYKIRINGKGSKQRFVYIVRNTIEHELKFIREHTQDFIAVTNQSKRMSRIGLYNIISSKMKKALINKSGVHILRHTMARNLVSKNINLKTISDLLGHSDIVLTARTYAKSNEANKIQAILT